MTKPNVIRILKPPDNAFNKNRRVSELLWAQVENLAAIVRRQIDHDRCAVRTEGQASDFIREMAALQRLLPKTQKGRIQDTSKLKKIVRVPRGTANASKRDEPVSDAVWERVEDLAAVLKRQIDNERRAINTEGQASAFIRKMTTIVHPQDTSKKPVRSSRAAQKKRPRSSR